MTYSLDNDFLCNKCKYQIEFYGAHRGGLYCQCGDCPKIIWHYISKCPCFKFDENKKHEQLFDLADYPKLLNEYEKH
jgi:hypothetical protein